MNNKQIEKRIAEIREELHLLSTRSYKVIPDQLWIRRMALQQERAVLVAKYTGNGI